MPPPLPTKMHALKVRASNDLFIDSTAFLPTLDPKYILIRVSHVALNPTDWKAASSFLASERPHTVGCDAMGRVVQCGAECGRDYEVGERVAGLCYGIRIGYPESGAFGEYALLKGGLEMKVPERVSDAEGATLGVGVTIVGQSLYQTLKLPLPEIMNHQHRPSQSCGPAILIYGGATATGLLAIQLARLSHCHIYTTCSPSSFQKCKSLGAHETFDYHGDADACARAIRAATNNNLLYAFDCISESDSLRICAGALTSRSDVAVYTATLPVAEKFPRNDVQAGWRSGYTAFGERYSFAGVEQEARPEDYVSARAMWEVIGRLVRDGAVDLKPLVQIREGGLDGIVEGLADLRKGRVKGGKLVYRIKIK